MDISIIGLVAGILLLAIPIYAFYRFGAPLIKQTLVAAARMVVQLLLIGLYLKYLFEWNSWWINLLWVIVMVMVAAFTAQRRTKLKMKIVLMPLCVGFFSAALLIGLYFLVVVLRLGNPFDARYFIPIMGILMGNMLGVNFLGLSTFYEGLRREQSLFRYLLGNGATHLEAVTPFVRRAIEKAFTPCIANMAVMGIVALPGTMTGQILGGSLPGIAVKYQIMIVIITFSSSMFSFMVSLAMSDKKSFDSLGRLKDIFTHS